MARLEIWVTNQLMQRLKAFAERQHGDSGRATLAEVVETALRWCLEKGGATETIVTHWEFPTSPISKENGNRIRQWLFRR